MSDEELSITKAAAELSSHFLGCMPNPDRSKGGLIDTRRELRNFPTEAQFDHAMEQHAYEGLEEAEISEHGIRRDPEDEVETRRSKKSKYAEKKARRLAEERQAERLERERKTLRKEARRDADERRAEFLREEARRRVRELRSIQEDASIVERSLRPAATPEPPSPVPPARAKPVFDPERANRRARFFGIRP